MCTHVGVSRMRLVGVKFCGSVGAVCNERLCEKEGKHGSGKRWKTRGKDSQCPRCIRAVLTVGPGSKTTEVVFWAVLYRGRAEQT